MEIFEEQRRAYILRQERSSPTVMIKAPELHGSAVALALEGGMSGKRF